MAAWPSVPAYMRGSGIFHRSPAGIVTARSAMANPPTVPGVAIVTVLEEASLLSTSRNTPSPGVQVSPPPDAAVKVLAAPPGTSTCVVKAAMKTSRSGEMLGWGSDEVDVAVDEVLVLLALVVVVVDQQRPGDVVDDQAGGVAHRG